MSEWIISSAVLTAIVIALRYILKGKISLRLQYALWAIVLIRLIVPINLGETALSIDNFTNRAAETEIAKNVTAIIEFAVPHISYDEVYGEVASEYAAKGIDIAALPSEEFGAVDNEIQARIEEKTSLEDILTALWLIGIMVSATVFVISNLRFSLKLRKTGHRLEERLVEECFGGRFPAGRISSEMADINLPIYVSGEVETPCLFGLFKPAIYITPETARDEMVLRHAVEHELTHYRHRDNVWAILRGVCLALHWYNPLVWWAAVLSGNDAELACDEATIKRIGEDSRADYGRTLIGMTCPKLPALFITATTMTGTKRSIKERITLLAKKPKTAAATLLAVLIILSLAAGCTFTGAKNPSSPVSGENIKYVGSTPVIIDEKDEIPEGVLDYAMNLIEAEILYFEKIGNDITEGKVFEMKKMELGDTGFDEEVYLYRLVHGVKPAKPEEIKQNEDRYIKDGYIMYKQNPCLILEKNQNGEEDVWDFVTSISDEVIAEKYGTPEYKEKYGDMYTAAAAELYKGYKKSKDYPIPINNNVVNEIPEPVLDYAVEYIRDAMYYYIEEQGYKLKEAEILDINPVSIGVSGLDDAVLMYNLRFRILPADTSEIKKTDGIKLENGYLTSWGEGRGEIYIMLYKRNGNSAGKGEFWEPLGAIGESAMKEEYNLPGVKKEFDNMYTAAAAKRYFQYVNREKNTPEGALEKIFSLSEVSLDINVNGKSYNSYKVGKEVLERYKVLIGQYKWDNVQRIASGESDQIITLSVGKKKIPCLSFFEKDGVTMITYTGRDTLASWKMANPESKNENTMWGLMYDLRAVYDNLDFDSSRISFEYAGDAKGAAEKFVKAAYGKHWLNLAPNGSYNITNYDVAKWEVMKIGKKGDSVLGWFEPVFTPVDFEKTGLWAGNTTKAKGKYEGKMTAYRQFVLEKQKDGLWHCTGLGTGGCKLPEDE